MGPRRVAELLLTVPISLKKHIILLPGTIQKPHVLSLVTTRETSDWKIQ